MATVSGNTGSEPLIGSKVIRDRGSDESIWSEKGSLNPSSDAKSDINCVRSESDRMPDGVERHLHSQ